MQNVLLLILTSIISGIIGVIISIYYHRRSDRYNAKMQTLKSFAGYRYDLRSDQFTKALNEIFVVFHDSPEVINKLSAFYDVAATRQVEISDQRYKELFESMCSNLGIDTKDLDKFFLTAFNPKQHRPL